MSNATLTLQNALIDQVFTGSTTASVTPTISAILSGVSTIYMSLHSANPGEGGSQTTSELSYTGYSRATVARAAGSSGAPGFTVDSLLSTCKNSPSTPFLPCTGGSGTAKYVGWGTASSGAGVLLAYAPIVASAMNWCVAFTNIKADAGTTADWVTVASHWLGADPVWDAVAGDELAILRVYDETMHTNLSASTAYYIRTAGGIIGTWPDPQSFQLTTTAGGGGGAVDISPGDNRCCAFQFVRVTPLAISAGVTPFIPALGAAIVAV